MSRVSERAIKETGARTMHHVGFEQLFILRVAWCLTCKYFHP